MDKKIEKKIKMLDGKYYKEFRVWFERQGFIGHGLEFVCYKAYCQGKEETEKQMQDKITERIKQLRKDNPIGKNKVFEAVIFELKQLKTKSGVYE